ncbi:hypothetical protein [Emticicia agri]|uniref:Lipocalin-like domain-containing protein n=1 Tax=Emticicia agri TaxID=2492393 RepID=A0A4Q5LXN0_9BACT|nr:hypothetical protein [Emticicia agri]RYU94273.1 hypothetical protein EWM59_17800 [Emticicia agri]
MKKLNTFFAGLMLLLLSLQVNAQTKKGVDYFEGKWKIAIPGTPLGDLKRLIILEKKDNGLSGVVKDDATGKEIAKISKVEVKDNEITIYYNANDVDAVLLLTRKDDEHVAGNLLEAYTVEGIRVKE